MNANEEASALKDHVLLSENLFTTFYKMVQAVRIHRDNNQLVIQSAEYFIRAVNRFGGDESRLTDSNYFRTLLSAAGKGSLSS